MNNSGVSFRRHASLPWRLSESRIMDRRIRPGARSARSLRIDDRGCSSGLALSRLGNSTTVSTEFFAELHNMSFQVDREHMKSGAFSADSSRPMCMPSHRRKVGDG